MMEENSDIFLAGGDALLQLAEAMHKKSSINIVWGHPFSKYISSTLLPLFAPGHILYDPHSISAVAQVINGWPIPHPKNK